MNRSATVRDYMSVKPITLSPDMDIHRAVKTLLKKRISGAPVVDRAGNLVGVLSKKDCLKVAFSAGYHHDWGGTVADYMSRNVETVDAGADVIEVIERFLKGPYRRFPVMEGDGLVGVISRYDALKALDDLW